MVCLHGYSLATFFLVQVNTLNAHSNAHICLQTKIMYKFLL
jgi:hypothetical protein